MFGCGGAEMSRQASPCASGWLAAGRVSLVHDPPRPDMDFRVSTLLLPRLDSDFFSKMLPHREHARLFVLI